MNRNPLDDLRISDLELLAMDYTPTSREVVLVLGECGETSLRVIAQFTSNYQLLSSTGGRRPRVVVLNAPAQIIPEIVRGLALEHVAIYQVLSMPNPNGE